MNYQGKYSNGSSAGRPGRRSRRLSAKLVLLVLALALLSGAVLGTLAYLTSQTGNVTNTFSPASVPNTPDEKIVNNVKTSIVIKNEGNISAYIRVRLVTYRVNDEGERIGGTATIPDFTLGTDWFQQGDFYYYKKPVSAGTKTGDMIGETGIKMESYTDADGGKQVIEVISESIQSEPATTVESVWPVTVETDGTLSAKGGNT